MKVKELKKLLKGVDGEMEVLMPVNQGQDTLLYNACVGQTGVKEIPDIELETDELGLVIIPTVQETLLAPKKNVFMILPCSCDEDDDIDPELN